MSFYRHHEFCFLSIVLHTLIHQWTVDIPFHASLSHSTFPHNMCRLVIFSDQNRASCWLWIGPHTRSQSDRAVYRIHAFDHPDLSRLRIRFGCRKWLVVFIWLLYCRHRSFYHILEDLIGYVVQFLGCNFGCTSCQHLRTVLRLVRILRSEEQVSLDASARITTCAWPWTWVGRILVGESQHRIGWLSWRHYPVSSSIARYLLTWWCSYGPTWNSSISITPMRTLFLCHGSWD